MIRNQLLKRKEKKRENLEMGMYGCNTNIRHHLLCFDSSIYFVTNQAPNTKHFKVISYSCSVPS